MEYNKKILNDIGTLIENNNNFTISCLIAGELIQENISDMLPVLKMESDSYIEVDVDVLKELVSNCKIAENIVNQAALRMFNNKTSFDEYCKVNNINLDTSNTFFEKFKLSSVILLQYQKYLINNKNLIDKKMTDFLDFLESDQKENAGFSYEELSLEQKKTIPKSILEWLSNC